MADLIIMVTNKLIGKKKNHGDQSKCQLMYKSSKVIDYAMVMQTDITSQIILYLFIFISLYDGKVPPCLLKDTYMLNITN